MLKTPDKIRELQRKLYRKAKQEKEFRFYLLYDKVYRMDILYHSYRLVRANKGTHGVDGVTFGGIEEIEGGVERYLSSIAKELKDKEYKPMPVRRVYIPKANGSKRPLGIPTIKDRIVQMVTKIVIEPIFEADFRENSYGFRPKRNAHQALKDIDLHLLRGNTKVIDADISKYFDTIPHGKLLKLVAQRIIDKNILKLIKMWLKTSIVEEGEDGKKRYKGNKRGTPQGGVISPLLANVYLNVLDTIWKQKKVQERYGARLVRYADDCVVLCKGNTDRILRGIRAVLADLDLTLNVDKTKIVKAKQASFNFLGFTFRVPKNPKTGKYFPLVRPSKEAVKQIRAEVKGQLNKRNFVLPEEVVIAGLNKTLRGWIGYFHYGHCTKDFSNLKYYVERRIKKYLRGKCKGNKKGYRAYSDDLLYRDLGLYKIPTTAPWTRDVKAYGRR